MIKVNLDADLLKVLRRIPYKLETIRVELKNEIRAQCIKKESAMQGMKI
jgi:hypothetical protein